MVRVFGLIVMLAFVGISAAIAADGVSGNGIATIAINGPGHYTVRPNQTISPSFVVKVTDASGNPLPGLNVQFFINSSLCAPLAPCNSPPAGGLYGHFVDAASHIPTNADGIATSPAFVAGSAAGGYQVAAWVDGALEDSTNAIIGTTPISVFFDVVQADPSLDAAPAASNGMLAALACLVLLATMTNRRRFRSGTR